MVLPKVKPPLWFVDHLEIISGSQIVVLDDDSSIHLMWKKRLSELNAEIGQLDFFRGGDFKIWLQENRNVDVALYLFDFELLGESQTGLDVIEETGIGKKAILITSRYEEEQVRQRCLRLGVRLIPKSLVGSFPLHVDSTRVPSSRDVMAEKLDAVLIDDDYVIRLKWKKSSEEFGKKIRMFSNAQEFYEAVRTINPQSPIYVDSHLENGVRGEAEAELISQKGFEEIYLTTGYDPSRFDLTHFPWIRRVVGKYPPWEQQK